MKNYLVYLDKRPVRLVFPIGEVAPTISENSLATEVLTDFRQKTPICINPGVLIDDALTSMKQKKVRCLFVVNHDTEVLGVITSRILSDHFVLEHMATHRIRSRKDVLVSDLMISKENIHAIDYDVFANHRYSIRDLIKAFCDLHVRYVFVTQKGQGGAVNIMGIISAADIARELRINLDPHLESLTFSSLGKHMNF